MCVFILPFFFFFFLFLCVRVVCICVSYFFHCTRFCTQDKFNKGQSRQTEMGFLVYTLHCWWWRWWSWAYALEAVRLAVQ